MIAALEVDEDRSLDFDEFCAVIKDVRGGHSQRYDVLRSVCLSGYTEIKSVYRKGVIISLD